MNKSRVIDLPSYTDDRGILCPVWNDWDVNSDRSGFTHGEETCAGINLRDVKRAYFIQNSQKGVVRGFHYHEHETKYFVVLRGMAKFVTSQLALQEAASMLAEGARCEVHRVELNPYDNETQQFTLSDHKQQMLIVPPGHANGWVSLSDDCILLALSSSTFEQSKNDDLRLDPYIFGDVWSVGAR